MRTVKRKVALVSASKRSMLEASCLAYTHEKKYWLDTLRAKKYQADLGSYRKIRDTALQNKYQSRCGLQARQWKLALQDAVETWNSYWQALFVQVREKIARHAMTEEERHYAFWLLKGYKQFTALMAGEIPEAPFPIERSICHQVSGYTQRTVRKLQGKPPTTQKARILKFDADCYEVFEKQGTQYIRLMSLQKGKRITLPLLGKSRIQGNISLFLESDSMEIHVSQELKSKPLLKNGISEAVDFGYTEVMTDTQNMRYGKELGKILTKATDTLHKKMKHRHKLHSLEKNTRLSHPKRSKRIRKYNLGKKKLNNNGKATKSSIGKEINTGINQLLKSKKVSLLITEDLSSSFTYKKSRALNRKLSYWVRGEIQKRISFKALTKCFRHEQVNPAYGSQTCSLCDFVDSRNRKGDEFRCLHCGHEDVSDRVAALNYAKRYGDKDIRRSTPYRQVKTILLNRFHRRLETGKPVTVPGRTLETV